MIEILLYKSNRKSLTSLKKIERKEFDMESFLVALAQCHSDRYQKENNFKLAEKYIKEAHEKQAKLILFPEMFVTGYLIKEKIEELAENVGDETTTFFSNLAKKYQIAIIFGFPEKSEGNIYNTACFIDTDGEIKGVYRKTHLFGENDEKMFHKGSQIFAFDTSLCRIGLLICYDIEFPEPSRILALEGAKLICMISANMYPYEEYHITYMKTRAMENSVYVISANAIGIEDEFHYCGKSAAFSPKGETLCIGDMDKECVYYAEIDIKKTTHDDDALNYLKHRRTDLYSKITHKK